MVPSSVEKPSHFVAPASNRLSVFRGSELQLRLPAANKPPHLQRLPAPLFSPARRGGPRPSFSPLVVGVIPNPRAFSGVRDLLFVCPLPYQSLRPKRSISQEHQKS